MRIAITGSCGYIGGCLVRRATAAGHEIIALGHDTNIDPVRPDVVIHAGWRGVRKGRNDVDLQSRNVDETITALERAVAAKAKQWICLGSQAEISISHTPYGAAKIAARDQVLQVKGIVVIWARLFSVYGPHAPSPSVIHDTIAGMRLGQELSYDSGQQEWDFLYEDDAADGVLALIGAPPGAYDVASGIRVQPRQVIYKLHDLAQAMWAPRFGHGRNPDLPVPNLAWATKIGWSPKVSLEEGLKRTIEEQP